MNGAMLAGQAPIGRTLVAGSGLGPTNWCAGRQGMRFKASGSVMIPDCNARCGCIDNWPKPPPSRPKNANLAGEAVCAGWEVDERQLRLGMPTKRWKGDHYWRG